LLHPHPKDAPCHGDRDPLIVVVVIDSLLSKQIVDYMKGKNNINSEEITKWGFSLLRLFIK
jgi:hypothetical protein